MSLSERKRQAILNGASECFQQYGVRASSMDMVAKQACVSKRTVYNHFGSKESLVTHLLTRMWAQMNDSKDIVYESDRDLRPQLVEAISHAVNLLSNEQYINLARVGVGHFLFSQDEFPEELKDIVQQESYLQHWISDAMADKRLVEEDPETAANHIYSLIKGGGHWPQVLRLRPILTDTQRLELSQQAADLFLNTYAV